METIICNFCDAKIYRGSTFCSVCGTRLKCSGCNAVILKDSNFCLSCGKNLNEKPNNNNYNNTVKYHRKKDEIFCEVSLTDTVGKEGIAELIKNLTNNHNVHYNQLNDVSDNTDNIVTLLTESDVPNSTYEKKQNGEIQKDRAIDELEKKEQTKVLDDCGLPHIDDLIFKVTDLAEWQWMLVFAFYISDFGKKTFSKTEVIDTYKEQRSNENRNKKIQENWRIIQKSFISTVRENTFKLDPSGIEKSLNFINGNEKKSTKRLSKTSNSDVKPKKASSNAKPKVIAEKEQNINKKSRSKAKENYNLLKNLDLNGNSKHKSFIEFCNSRIHSTAINFNTIAVYYLKKIKQIEIVTPDHIYTCYKEFEKEVPTSLIQSLRDTSGKRYGYIDASDMNNLNIPLRGENYVEFKIKLESKK